MREQRRRPGRAFLRVEGRSAAGRARGRPASWPRPDGRARQAGRFVEPDGSGVRRHRFRRRADRGSRREVAGAAAPRCWLSTSRPTGRPPCARPPEAGPCPRWDSVCGQNAARPQEAAVRVLPQDLTSGQMGAPPGGTRSYPDHRGDLAAPAIRGNLPCGGSRQGSQARADEARLPGVRAAAGSRFPQLG